MENLSLLPQTVVVARKSLNQLNVSMNLPVRLISDNNIIDVVPMDPDPSLTKIKKIRNAGNRHPGFMTLDEMILFFKDCMPGDLLTQKEVAKIYDVCPRTLRTWIRVGLFKVYYLHNSFSVIKRAELPTMEQIYGPYEL